MNKRNFIGKIMPRNQALMILSCVLYLLTIPVVAETKKAVITKENYQLVSPTQLPSKELAVDKDKLLIPTNNLRNINIYELEKNLGPVLTINPDIIPVYPLGGRFIPLPDLAVTAGLDSQNRLIVRVRNDGREVVPAGVGNISIYIDGAAIGSYDLGRLSNQAFRTPGGHTDIPSNFRLAGALRRVLVRVDTANQVVESNEHQNDYSVTLNPPRLTGPDYVIESIGT